MFDGSDRRDSTPPQTYPAAPWRMHGTAVMRAFATPVDGLALPAGLEAVHVGGWSVGALAYVEYLPPSPLVYRELLWMPCLVRATGAKGRAALGAFVARIYVDDRDSLEGGRAIWSLPKEMARFTARGGAVQVRADDGTAIDLTYERLGPSVPLRSHAVTLQRDDAGLVRFRADFAGATGVARLRVARFESDHPGWSGFARRKAVPLPAASLAAFDATMQAPERLVTG